MPSTTSFLTGASQQATTFTSGGIGLSYLFCLAGSIANAFIGTGCKCPGVVVWTFFPPTSSSPQNSGPLHTRLLHPFHAPPHTVFDSRDVRNEYWFWAFSFFDCPSTVSFLARASQHATTYRYGDKVLAYCFIRWSRSLMPLSALGVTSQL